MGLERAGRLTERLPTLPGDIYLVNLKHHVWQNDDPHPFYSNSLLGNFVTISWM